MLEHGRMKSNDFRKSCQTSQSKDEERTVKRNGIATFTSETLGSPVNPKREQRILGEADKIYCREPDEERTSRPVRRAGKPDPTIIMPSPSY